MPLNIYITGFMGAGKSRLGRELSHRLKRPLLDTDAEFSRRHGGQPVGDFIREKGEAAFRVEEQALLRELASRCVFHIISTGGGIPSYPGNRQIMKDSGITVTLKVPLEVLERRLPPQEMAKRPLWSTENAAQRRALFEARQPDYAQAEYILDGVGETEEIAASFLSLAHGWLEKAPCKTPAFQQLMKKVSRDSAEFSLFAQNDRILVGLSGGEDSMMLMHLLTQLQRRLPFRMELFPAVIDLGYPGFDASALERYAQRQHWQLELLRVEGVQEFLQGKPDWKDKPCPLCSRLRRGKLHGLMEKLHCNKLALGHHLDDLCVSFLISLFRGGGLKTMAPNAPADGGKYRLIRPLWGCRKAELHAAAEFFRLPAIRSCPYEATLREKGDRHFLQEELRRLEERFPDLVAAMRHSLGDVRKEHLLDHQFLP